MAVAPNGGRRTKSDHPALPLTAGELARTAAECVEQGASMIHLHVRDQAGKHLLDAEAYRAATARIYETVGDRLVVQITSEAVGAYSVAEQKAVVLETNPEAVSLALREFAPDKAGEKEFGEFLGQLKLKRIWPQIILYSPDEAARLSAMRRQGLIPFEVGRSALCPRALRSRPDVRAGRHPAVSRPGVAAFRIMERRAFGRRETACVTTAALLGGHARVGFENNVLMPDGALAASNADLVGAVARALDALGMAKQSVEGLRQEIAAAMAT